MDSLTQEEWKYLKSTSNGTLQSNPEEFDWEFMENMSRSSKVEASVSQRAKHPISKSLPDYETKERLASMEKELALLKKKEQTQNALTRCEKSIGSLEQYLASLTVEHLDYSKIESVMESYNNAGEKLDLKKAELTEQLRELDTEIEKWIAAQEGVKKIFKTREDTLAEAEAKRREAEGDVDES